MDQAMDRASKSPARWLLVWLGLGVCVTETGCAKLRSYAHATPVMLAAAAPFKKTQAVAPPGGDLYAKEVGRGVSDSRALLARERAESQARDAVGRPRPETRLARAQPATSERPAPPPSAVETATGVALQPPVTIAQRQNAPPAQDDLPPLPGAASEAPAAELPAAASEAPAGGAPAASAATDFATVISDAKTRLETIASYQVPIKRQERVGNTLLPAEEFVLNMRRNPKAVRLEWPDGPSKGREVIYSASANDGMMHVKMPDSIVPVPPMALAPDSPMVMRSSRHPITEAGFDVIVENLEKTVAQSAAGDPSLGKVTYGGLDNPGQLARPSHKLIRLTPSGETWLVYIDPTTKLPVMIEGTAANGDLLERYLFGEAKLDLPELASDDAFDPQKRWGSSGGLLSRLARAGAGASKPAEETAPR